MTAETGELRPEWTGIDVDVMDCEADNLAVLLRFHGAGDVLTPFGAEWHLGATPDGALALNRHTVDELVASCTGFELHRLTPGAESIPDTCDAQLAAGRPTLVYADAYFLPWLPYFGAAHMEHTFLVTGASPDGRSYAITDAYHNPTQWGLASPVRTRLERFGVIRASTELATHRAGCAVIAQPAASPPPPRQPEEWLAENAIAVTEATRDHVLANWADSYRSRLGEPGVAADLAVTCWLAQRRRALHARWLTHISAQRPDLLPDGYVDHFSQEVVSAWGRASEYSYVAQRRAEMGKPPPMASLDLIATQVEQAEYASSDLLLRHTNQAELATGRC